VKAAMHHFVHVKTIQRSKTMTKYQDHSHMMLTYPGALESQYLLSDPHVFQGLFLFSETITSYVIECNKARLLAYDMDLADHCALRIVTVICLVVLALRSGLAHFRLKFFGQKGVDGELDQPLRSGGGVFLVYTLGMFVYYGLARTLIVLFTLQEN
jgi:hypothetical protein